MKYINPQSERLSKRNRELEAQCNELKERNRVLQKENTILRLTHLKRTVTIKTTISATESNPSSPNTPRYACTTASSRSKTKIERQKVLTVASESEERRVTIDNQQYKYRDGIPIPVVKDDVAEPAWLCVSHYMKATGASKERDTQIRAENEARARKVASQVHQKPARTRSEPESPTWGSEWESSTCSPPYESSWEEPIDTPTFSPSPPITPSPPEDGMQDELGDNRAEATRPPQLDNLVVDIPIIKTESKTNLSYLEKAHRIAKDSVWTGLMAGRLGNRSLANFKDGPHLIALGYLELKTLLGERSQPCMAQNGFSAPTIYGTIFDVTPLRNMVCHGNAEELRDPLLTDDRLKRALRVAIVLGNEEGANEVRAFREALRAEAQAACDWVRDMHALVSQPGYEADWDLQPHQEDMFRWILRNWDSLKMKGQSLEGLHGVYESALAWLNWKTEDGSLSRDDEFYDIGQEDSE
ncbi:hypothetical protein NPX13_g3893 [Xylaria arbuscula]|uniref:Uncharacterized protein n=1 Tax=Xylaria arbuscula TaxID=114810 RepID=A0A9W8NGH0_9PEZI|nr:hypothetical protein NPX13_g3893 [Xylaria arbuscula]